MSPRPLKKSTALGLIAMVVFTHYQTDPRCCREATLTADAGCDVHFYTLSKDGKTKIQQVEGIILQELPMPRFRGASSSSYLLSYVRFLLLAYWAVQRDHLQRRFDIVHVNTMPDFRVAVDLLPRLLGTKVILDIHDVMPEIYMIKFQVPDSPWKIRLIRGRIEVLSARWAHSVLTAEHPKGELLKEYGIPPIFTPTKTVRHFFGDNHPLIIQDPNPEETAKKIRWVRNNYGTAKQLTAELQDSWFSRYRWPEHKPVYLRLLENLKSTRSREDQPR